jgi:Uncharacterized alpha/beta hydrolase domain (DUF2235)
MKRINVCFDGTWNKPADEYLPTAQQIETNVSRFFKSVSDKGTDGTKQVKWYDAVGTENYRGPLTDSYAEFLKGLYAKKNPRHYRSIAATRFGHEVVDNSVQQRRKADRSYEPQNNGLPKLT